MPDKYFKHAHLWLDAFSITDNFTGRAQAKLRTELAALLRRVAEEADREGEKRGIKMGAAMARDIVGNLLHPTMVGEQFFVDRVVSRLTPCGTNDTAAGTRSTSEQGDR
jgi:hypothetical protein